MAFDKTESTNSTKLLLIFAVIFALIVVIGVALLPDMSGALNEFNNGVGFKDGAIYAFITTLVLLVILSIAAGDGLIGEIQFLLIGFLVFFFIIWLFITWIF